jgi:hypothetical protein
MRDAQQARQHAQQDRSVLELLQRIERGQKNASRKDYYKVRFPIRSRPCR